jgi:hypothetical protein
MSCCSTPGTPGSCGQGKCPCNYICWLPRIAFGLVLVGFGVNHYRTIGDFVMNAKSVFTIPLLASLAGYLAYVVPALMIVGGVLFATRQLCCISKTCIVASLSGIIGWAGLSIMLDNGSIPNLAQGQSGAIMNAIFLFLFYKSLKKGSCAQKQCSTQSCPTGSSCCK